MSLAVSIVVLVALLACIATTRLDWPEVAFGVPAALLLVVTGIEPLSGLWHQVRVLFPTLAFLAGMFVIAESAGVAGLFDRAEAALGRLSHRGDRAILTGVAVLAVAITSVLSLDATVVLFTPVVLRLVRGRRRRIAEASLLATVLLANGGSLILPVANLTNLLALQQTHLSFTAYTARAALPGLAAAIVIGWICRSAARADDDGAAIIDSSPTSDPVARRSSGIELSTGVPTTPVQRLDPVAVTVAVVAGVLLAGFFIASAFGVSPAWVACGGAVVLGVIVVATRRAAPARVARATSPGFLLFVVTIAVVVDAVSRHGIARLLDRNLPQGHGLGALAGMAALAALAAAVLNNLPATLLLLPALRGRAALVVIAALIGLNIGPNLMYTGSLATLLWRRVVRAAGAEPAPRRFFGLSFMSTPLAITAAVVVLWGVGHLVTAA